MRFFRRLGVLLLLMMVLTVSTTRADVTLEVAVNAVTINHAPDDRLHDIAHQRAVEIVTDFSHAAMRPGTAEVLAWNSGYPDPAAHIVQQWLTSPVHLAILTNPAYTLMGCATHTVGVAFYAACVLSDGPTVPTVSPTPEPVPTDPVPTEPVPTVPEESVEPVVKPTPLVQMLPDAAMAP